MSMSGKVCSIGSRKLQPRSGMIRAAWFEANLNPQFTFIRTASGAPPITTKTLLDRYSKKNIFQNKEVDYIDKNKSLKGKENVRLAKSMDGFSKSLGSLNSEEDPLFKKHDFRAALARFQGNSDISLLMESLGITSSTYNENLENYCLQAFTGKILRVTYPDCIRIFKQQGNFGLERHFLSGYLSYLLPRLSEKEMSTFRYYQKMTDLSRPAESYPKARRMQRKIIMHVGPTNSGKTYRALKKLGASNRGIYCGPLRLLAYEVWKKFIDQGLPCDLVTGEERITAKEYFLEPSKFCSLESEAEFQSKNIVPVNRESPFFHDQRLVSATTEMLSVNELYDIAVIDEIQLLGDQQRGWAWARALIGVQAHEIHLCGEASAVPIVKDICRELNEEVEVNEYSRLSPLEISKESLKGYYKNIREGDCFVAFSRSAIFRHKSAIECVTGLKCAVVYGKLPPENRAQQARLFNDSESKYKVMVASDAVGMGLNLNIRRIIFDSLEKFDGKTNTLVPVPQVKQIAGRAGRFNTAFKDGVAMCFENEHSKYLTHAMNLPPKPIKKIGIQPEFESLKLFSYQFPKDTLAQLLIKYAALATVSSRYFICFSEEHLRISNLLASLPLTIEDRQIFLMAPVNTRDSQVAEFTLKIATAHAFGQVTNIEDLIEVPPHHFNFVDPSELLDLEVSHKCIMVYFWLSHRLPYTICDIDRAQVLKVSIEKRLGFLLPRTRVDKTANARPNRTFSKNH